MLNDWLFASQSIGVAALHWGSIVLGAECTQNKMTGFLSVPWNQSRVNSHPSFLIYLYMLSVIQQCIKSQISFYSRWSTNKSLICIVGICLISWMAGHSKQYINAWMENNCSLTELITVTICIFSCISLLCPGLWSVLHCCYQMTCICCAPLIALPAWHLASFPLPESQDPSGVLTVTCICLFPLQLAWEMTDSSPPCRWGRGLGGECCFSIFQGSDKFSPVMWGSMGYQKALTLTVTLR